MYETILHVVFEDMTKTVKEKYESVYFKLVELSNTFSMDEKTTLEKYGEVDNSRLVIIAGQFVSDMFDTSTTACHFGIPLDELNEYCRKLRESRLAGGRTYLGTFRGGIWKVYQDSEIPVNQAVVEFQFGHDKRGWRTMGKGLLIVDNLTNLEENADKST